MAKAAGYWVELGSVKFNEDGTSTWIHSMPIGTYEHPVYGTMDFTPERILQFANNVNNNVRTTQLDIDYEHKAQDGKAAGWVNKAETRADGLWLLVDWTKKAAQEIKDKAYRYFSPEFNDEWTDPKSNITYKDVLFGGGITNRPFLKDLMPINMSEVFANAGNKPTNQKGKSMNEAQLKALAEKLGIPADSSADVIHAKLLEELAKEKTAPAKTVEQLATELAEAEKAKQLSESSPEVRALMEAQVEGAKQLAEVRKQLRDQSIDNVVKTLSDSFVAKKCAIAPATLEALKKGLVASTSKELSDALIASVTSIADAAVVALGERGAGRNNEKTESGATDQFLAAIKKLQETNAKMTFAEASTEAARKDPQLFAEYTQEAYLVKI